LDRLDLARDELVEVGKVSDQVGWQCKIQGSSPRCRFPFIIARPRETPALID
jgi:hypothetical protein